VAARPSGRHDSRRFRLTGHQLSNPYSTLLRFTLTPFITGVDLYRAAATPPTGSVVLESRQRGGNGAVSRVAVPNWASSGHTVTVNFDDYVF
jgi:uncharacterized protein